MPFSLRLRVAPTDIDDVGHVNNLVYLRWVQDVATAHWRTVAPHEDQAAIVWIVLRHEIDYKAPAFVGEEIVLQTNVIDASSGVTFERHTTIMRAADERVLARARTIWCPLNHSGKPQRLPMKLRRQFMKDSSTVSSTDSSTETVQSQPM